MIWKHDQYLTVKSEGDFSAIYHFDKIGYSQESTAKKGSLNKLKKSLVKF